MKKYILLALATMCLVASAEFDNGKLKDKKGKKSKKSKKSKKHKKHPEIAEKLKELEAK